ncbi:hypothetical protein GLOIN_2v1785846 [Rhizophagus irregularis DAOM 181602=DAOM 197198]|uniref:Serine-enriched protein n=3 Tax=Rhizophagus irregularis TaxID=588596 RepID=A0A015JTJ4_RHIIW|nr:hypothetical protein RirG_064890 [Rhizophagus irregularis DAOM 197198w]GBC44254.2 hypothetical protein GLOIN_2v1785846 [Rhizophagus irregularis DAOM 181602=DAOM 197198]
MTDFLITLSRDFANIMEDSDEYNVLIKVGADENDEKSFHAHSLVLRARSPYFKTALSNNWAKKENDITVFYKPNISPYIFELILKFMYAGEIAMDQLKGKDLLKLLVASDELLLNELHNAIQDYLLLRKSDWLQRNFSLVHKTVFQLELSKGLQEFCLETICEDPQTIFRSKDFTNLEEEILIGLLVRNDLDMEESVIWDHLLEWGIAQNPELTIDVSKWKNEDFTLLKETLDNLIPLVRFFVMTSAEFYNKVRPFKKILSKELYEDLKRYHLKTGLQLKSDYLQTPRYNGVKSSIIDKNHAAMLCSWIDGVDSTSIPNLTNYNGDLPYELRLLCKGSRDGFSASIFHDLCDNQGPTITCLKVNDSKHVIGGYNPLSWGSTNSWRNTRDAFIFQFNIYYKKNLTAKIGRVITNSSAYAVNDSQSTGPCFGDGDLWLRDQFDQPGNCSCNKESYDQSVGDMFHRDSWESWTGAVKNGTFAVEDYEVFQVIRKRINNT